VFVGGDGSLFPANARALLMPPRGRGVLLGDDAYRFPVIGKARHRAALEEISAGQSLRCAALLTPNGRDYDSFGVMVSIRGREVGFLHWMDGHDFRNRLRKAGFLEAVCKAKITEDHLAGDGWEYVGVTIDAFRPFTFTGTDEWHSRRAQRDRPLLRSTSGGAGLSTVLKTFRKSLFQQASLPSLRKIDWSKFAVVRDLRRWIFLGKSPNVQRGPSATQVGDRSRRPEIVERPDRRLRR
jgi:hypothetical protein